VLGPPPETTDETLVERACRGHAGDPRSLAPAGAVTPRGRRE